MRERITGCGTTDGEYIDIQPVEYKRGNRDYALVKRIAELEAKLKRLGSSEAFDVARSIDKERDAELIARMDYANEALGENDE